jgi:hypothetical protein
MRRLTVSRRKVLLLAGAALAGVAVVVLANHSVARPAGDSIAAVCKRSTYSPNQPIVIAKVDATASTHDTALRLQYARALDGVGAAAAAVGAYLVVDTFGSDPTETTTLCETSTRLVGAAPLFVTARTSELRRVLDDVARKAGNTNEGGGGSAVYGALVGAVERVQALRSTRRTPATIVLISDGDEATKQTHLRLLLESGASNATIVNRVVGKLPLPDARGISIEMYGIGRAGTGRPISTTGARRMLQIWQRICGQTHPVHCSVTTDLPNNLSFRR